MLLVYAFALIVGGGLLGASLLFGGHGDSDTASGAEGEADAHADTHAHGHGSHDTSEAHGGLDAFWLMFLSMRFWTFFLAFFGLTGLVLEGFGILEGALLVAPVAAGMGLASGAGVSLAVRALKGRESTSAISADDYIGRSARVLLAVSRDRIGKARLELKGQSIDVVATTEEDQLIPAEEEALVVEMRGTTAVLARPGRAE